MLVAVVTLSAAAIACWALLGADTAQAAAAGERGASAAWHWQCSGPPGDAAAALRNASQHVLARCAPDSTWPLAFRINMLQAQSQTLQSACSPPAHPLEQGGARAALHCDPSLNGKPHTSASRARAAPRARRPRPTASRRWRRHGPGRMPRSCAAARSPSARPAPGRASLTRWARRGAAARGAACRRPRTRRSPRRPPARGTGTGALRVRRARPRRRAGRAGKKGRRAAARAATRASPGWPPRRTCRHPRWRRRATMRRTPTARPVTRPARSS